MNSSDAEKRLKSFVRVLDTTGLGRGMTQAIRLAPYDRKLSFIFKYAPAISIVPCIGFYFAFLPFMPPFSMTVVVEIAIALGLPALLSPIYMPKLMRYMRLELVRKFERQVPMAEVADALRVREENVPVEVRNVLRALQQPRSKPWEPKSDAEFFYYCAAVGFFSRIAHERVK